MIPDPVASVVVLNWNRKDLLAPCLDALLTQTADGYELILVDNGSTDGSVEFVKASYAARVRVIANPDNYGFAKGMNVGLAAAQGRFIAILNNDAVVTPSWLAELVKGMALGDDVGMCAPKILFSQESGAPDRRVIDNTGHLIYLDGLYACRGRGELDRGQYDRTEEILWPDGSAALYRKAMLDETGLFDEDFFSFCEDADLGFRARLRGWRCLYIPTAVVHHVRSATAGRRSPKKAMLVERNRCWLALKNFPLPLLALAPLFTLIRFFWHAYAVVRRRGSGGTFVAEHSPLVLLHALTQAYGSAFRGVPSMVRKRRHLQRTKTLSDLAVIRLLWCYRVSAREVALRDR